MSYLTSETCVRPRLDVALEALANGYHVFPCGSNKKPLTTNGWKDASTDPEAIQAWWAAYPDAMPSIAVCDGVVMLDFDTKPDQNLLADEVFDRLNWELPETYEEKTGGGGFHMWFQYPEEADMALGIGAGVFGIKGFDVRSNGGYSCIHFDAAPPPRAQLAPLPMHYHAVLPRFNAKHHHAAHPIDLSDFDGNETTPEGAALLEEVFGAWMSTERGSRNDKANALGFRVGKAVAASHVSPIDAQEVFAYAQAHWSSQGSKDHTQTFLRGLEAGVADDNLSGVASAFNKLNAARTARLPPPLSAQPPSGASSAFVQPYTLSGPMILNDQQNARLMVEIHGQDMCHSPEGLGTGWHFWNGSCWETDAPRIMRLAGTVGDEWRRIAPQADPTQNQTVAGRPSASNVDLLLAWATEAGELKRINAMQTLATSVPGISVPTEDFDSNPWVLSTPGCSYDLHACAPYTPRREDYCTKQAGGNPDGQTGCAVWLSFLDRIFDHDADVIAFIQRSVGYCLTGSVQEQKWFQCHGEGANGKTTFIGVLKTLLGSYAMSTPVETWLRKRDSEIPNAIAALAGARMVSCSEPKEDAVLDEALLKKVTGGDPIEARFLHKEFFTYQPTFKIWMLTNRRLVIRGDDDGFWRRVLYIPFNVQIPAAEQDHDLDKKLRAEAGGIFEWALEGLREWHRVGLAPPASVLAATAEYRADMDILANFIEECCVVNPAGIYPNKALYADYRLWAIESGQPPRSQKWFTQGMERKKVFKQDSGGNRAWHGLCPATHANKTMFGKAAPITQVPPVTPLNAK